MVPEASRSMLVWFWIAVATEIYTSSNHIWLLVFDDKTVPYGLFSTTSIPRAIIYLFMARKLAPKNWWRYLVTVDNILGQTIILTILYGFMTLSPSANGQFGFRVAAVVLQPVHQLAFNCSFRCMTKFFPWGPVTIMVYKFVRLYAATVAMILYLLIKANGTIGLDSSVLLVHLSLHTSYNLGLLTRVPSWTSYKRTVLKNLGTQKASIQPEEDIMSSTSISNQSNTLAQPLLASQSIDSSHAAELRSLRAI